MPLTVEYSGKKKALPGTPASTLAEIFMQACEAFCCDPSSHTLRYKKKALDLTLPLRLANLPAGCVAELSEIDAKEAATRTVQVVLQRMVVCETSGDLVPSGSRSQAAFLCTKTLWEVLRALEDISGTRLVSGCDERGEIPCVSCMNAKKEGKSALEATSLLHLGFVSGSALLKHSFAPAAPAPAQTQLQEQPPTPQQPEQVEDGSAGDAMEVDSAKVVKTAPAVNDADAITEEGAGREGSDQPANPGTEKKLMLQTKMGVRQYTVGRPREDVSERSATEVEVEDDFFELTAADIAVLEAAKKAKEKQPAFKTRKMREMEKEVKLAAFKDVKIRFIFPNQHYIQGLFKPSETLAHLFDFVRDTLVQKDRLFILTTTPPPTKLVEDDKTLIKYTHLMPSARVYFTWAQPPLEPPYMAFTFISEMQQLEEEERKEEMKAPMADGASSTSVSGSARPGESSGEGDGGERQSEASPVGPFVPFSGQMHSLGGEGGESELEESEEGRRQAAISAAEKRQSASAVKGKASNAQREREGLGHAGTDTVMKKAPKWFKMA